VLVIAGRVKDAAEDVDPAQLMSSLMADGMSRREAAREVARRTGRPSRELYRASVDPGED
jgi:hypothetical protein